MRKTATITTSAFHSRAQTVNGGPVTGVPVAGAPVAGESVSALPDVTTLTRPVP